jgi:hypothetical protein
MASAYSVTILIASLQLDPYAVSHVTIAVNTPDGSIFAGFGPNYDSSYIGNAYSGGKCDMQYVPPGGTPTVGDWSIPLNDNVNASFTIPTSESQAYAIVAAIGAFGDSVPNYNVLNLTVCSTVIGQCLQAGGLGNPISAIPNIKFQEFKSISDTLAANPGAQYYYSPTFNQFLPVPEGVRGLQQDYARIGRGFDTPSEMRGVTGNGGENVSSSYFSTSGNAITNVISAARDTITNATTSAWRTVTNTASAALDSVTGAASSARDYIESTASSVRSTVTNWLEQGTSAEIDSTQADLAFVADSIITPAHGETNPATPASFSECVLSGSNCL